MNLHEVELSSLSMNPFDLISKGWFLITSGEPSHFNTMTASWGTIGFLWGKPVINAYIRPQRYTHEFVEANDLFTISFFDEEYRSALQYCGSHSGRDENKAQVCGLTPVKLDGTTAFAEAKLVLVCKKLYRYTICPEEMIDTDAIEKWYPNHDYHDGYYGEILKAYQP